jgi:hypothetical protein
LPALAARRLVPASTLLALFVAGAEVPIARLGALAAPLATGGWIDVTTTTARARWSIVPLGDSWLVCDRVDRPVARDTVCWPDDSSHHLALSIPPGRRARWLDLGTGSAYALLLRPGTAGQRIGSDLNPRALELARRGAELSNVAVELMRSDLDADLPESLVGRCNLVTCNPPIPSRQAGSDSLWRAAEPSDLARLVPAARRVVAAQGMIVIHAALEILLALRDVTGERVVVEYTPPGVPGFAVAWWRPDADDRWLHVARPLTPQRPHLTYDDRTAAMSGDVR